MIWCALVQCPFMAFLGLIVSKKKRFPVPLAVACFFTTAFFGVVMANWQALTFGGWAPAETQGESAMSFAWNGKDLRRNIRYQKRMIRFQNEQSKAMSLWSAHQMPSATMKGLRDAGLNPLLAAGGSTNVAPAVASSAASVPYSESYAADGSTNGMTGDVNSLVDLFSGTSSLQRKARKSVANATIASSSANEAEQKARKAWFESDEGRKAVRDKLRMDYGPQSTLQAATLGAHTAGDAANAVVDSRGDGGTTNQFFAWLYDNGRGTSPIDAHRNHSNVRRWSRSDNSRRDSNHHNRNTFHFHFGGSAKPSLHSNTNRPVWYNPDLK